MHSSSRELDRIFHNQYIYFLFENRLLDETFLARYELDMSKMRSNHRYLQKEHIEDWVLHFI